MSRRQRASAAPRSSSAKERSPADPLTAARLRGQSAREALLAAEGGPLTESEVSALLTITPQEVETRRRTGRLLAIEQAPSGYSYPSWQFVQSRPLLGL